MSPSPRSDKLYYSIGEVSRIVDLPQSVLRYWETEFSGLRPPRNRAGKRLYRQQEIERVQEIKRLLHKERFTIEGARKALKQKSHADPVEEKKEGVQRKIIEEIREGLKEILELLDR